MDPDALMPGGTFVEFSWYSFESDGPMDSIPIPLEETESLGAKEDNETLPGNRKDETVADKLRLSPLEAKTG